MNYEKIIENLNIMVKSLALTAKAIKEIKEELEKNIPQEKEEQSEKIKTKPTIKEWKEFWAKVNTLGLTNNDVKELLNVNSVKDLLPEFTLDEVFILLKEKAQKKNGTRK